MRSLPLLFFLGALAVPAPALAGVQMSPAIVDQRVQTGDRIGPITVTNDTPLPAEVRFDHAVMRQQRTGYPAADPAGRSFLRLSRRTADIPAGGRATLYATVVRAPRRDIGLYGTIAATASFRPAPGSASRVDTQVGLTGVALLRFPGAARHRGSVPAITVEQAAERTLRFTAALRNAGNVHVRPQVRLQVLDADGEVRHRASIETGHVIPRAVRDFFVDMDRPVLPAGEYVARIEARLGSHRATRTQRFRLVGPNELPTPKVEVVELAQPSSDAGEPVHTTVTLRNTGSAPIAPTGEALLTVGGGKPSRIAVDTGTIAPGESVERDLRFAETRGGPHELSVRFRSQGQVVAERTIRYVPGFAPAEPNALLAWLEAHLAVVFGALAALLAALGVFAVTRIRRLKRRLRAAEGAAIEAVV